MGETNPFQLRKFELFSDDRGFRKLVSALDVGFVRLDGMALGFETRAFTLLLEEAIKRISKMFDADLNRCAIDFLQPVELLLQQGDLFETRAIGKSFSSGPVHFLPLRQKVVEDETRTSNRLRNQNFLLFCRIDSKFIGLVFQHFFHLLQRKYIRKPGWQFLSHFHFV